MCVKTCVRRRARAAIFANRVLLPRVYWNRMIKPEINLQGTRFNIELISYVSHVLVVVVVTLSRDGIELNHPLTFHLALLIAPRKTKSTFLHVGNDTSLFDNESMHFRPSLSPTLSFSLLLSHLHRLVTFGIITVTCSSCCNAYFYDLLQLPEFPAFISYSHKLQLSFVCVIHLFFVYLAITVYLSTLAITFYFLYYSIPQGIITHNSRAK